MKVHGRGRHARLWTPPTEPLPPNIVGGRIGIRHHGSARGAGSTQVPLWVGAGLRRHWRDGSCGSGDRGLFFSTSSSLNRTCVWGTTFTRTEYTRIDNPRSVHQ